MPTTMDRSRKASRFTAQGVGKALVSSNCGGDCLPLPADDCYLTTIAATDRFKEPAGPRAGRGRMGKEAE